MSSRNTCNWMNISERSREVVRLHMFARESSVKCFEKPHGLHTALNNELPFYDRKHSKCLVKTMI